MTRSLADIGFDRNLPPLLFIFAISEQICLTTFSGDYNLPLNAMQLIVLEVLMFHVNTELLPSGDSRDLSPGNNDTTNQIKLFLVGMHVINKLVWVEVLKDDLA